MKEQLNEMKEQLADYLGIAVDEIRDFKRRGESVFVINGRFQKLKVDAARLAAHGVADAPPSTGSGNASTGSDDALGEDEPDITEPDNLERIDGIGGATVKKLNGAGIFTFAQMIAADSEQTAIDCTLPLSKLRAWQVEAEVLV